MSDSFAKRLTRAPLIFDAQRARRMELELAGRGLDDNVTALLAAVASNSPYLTRQIEWAADGLADLLSNGPEPTFDQLLVELNAPAKLSRNDMLQRLRTGKRKGALLIALADAGGIWTLDQVTRALTRLADTTLTAALRFVLNDAAERGRFEPRDETDHLRGSNIFFLAMGKYGAFELNYSSDIDFSCYFDSEALPAGKGVEPRELAVRLTQATVALMQELTADGYVFRCDLRLRPDAGSTQIAVSTRAAESYYETMGQNWERAAMIKSRVCAGDIACGEAFRSQLQPFVWRKYLDYAAIEDIHSIKRQIHAHGGHGSIAVAGHNIKLGRGGIREIEFFAQTQQLILGGRIPTLRSPRTLDALQALVAREVIEEATRAHLEDAYVFLRTLEHRLQMIEDEQTHTLPKSSEGLLNVARFMGFEDAGEFSTQLTARLQIVQSHYARLFEGKPSLSKQTGSLVFTGVDDDPETIQTLKSLNFSQPEAISATIRGWHHGRIRATRSEKAREKLTAIMPRLLEALSKTANPDIAFTRFDKFLSGLPSGVQVFALLFSNPNLLDLIAEIVGTAPRLADHLAARPGLLDVLIDIDFLRHRPSREELRDGLQSLLGRTPTFEDVLDIVRRWAKDQQFRVGLQLLKSEISGVDAGMDFADIAEVCIGALYEAVLAETVAASGALDNGGMVIVALGRLGGREMTAASDLDLIFVYDFADGVIASTGKKALSPSQYYARASQRLITSLTAMTSEGGLYDVDMRLRPSGNKGPVAVSFETFSKYQSNEAWTWERLALTRARVIAGPEDLRAKTENLIRATLTAPRDARQILADVASMRARLDKERPAKSPWDLKEAKGGLFDVEFIAQALQLVHAQANSQVLSVNTLDALKNLIASSAIAPEFAERVLNAAHLYQSLTQVLRLTVEGHFQTADASQSLRGLIARTCSVGSFDEVEQELRRVEADTRVIFNRLIAAGAAP